MLTDISAALVCAEKLEYLDISDTGVRLFEWLPSLKKLEVLRANNVGLSDLSVLEPLIYLEQLSLSGNQIQSLDGLNNTSKMTKVDLSNNGLTDVSVLSRNINSLAELHLENNRIEDLAFLAEAVNLKKVYVDGNCLTDLNWLLNNRGLQILSASRNSIQSIKGLGIGKNLRYLNLADNLLTEIGNGDLTFGDDLYPIVNLQNNDLESLELGRNCTYKQIVLLGNPRLDLKQLQGINGWNLYFDFPAEVELQTLKALDFNDLCIVGCPLARQVEIEEGLSGEELMTLEEAMEEILQAAKDADY
jgi:Leucine-rich repeat (LRR) protein